MKRRTRLFLFLISLVILLVVGRLVTGSFSFALSQFWFTSGLFLLLLLSLIDQPHFSKDANVFVNAVTGWVALLLVPGGSRSGIWWAFLAWTSYLAVSSYALIWLRSRDLGNEGPGIQLLSRVNREVGRPEALFSAFFLWGCVLQFGSAGLESSALFFYWAVFMILNQPALARILDTALEGGGKGPTAIEGSLEGLVSPRVAAIRLPAEFPVEALGLEVELVANEGEPAALGVIFDDRIVSGVRLGRVGLTSFLPAWQRVVDAGPRRPAVKLTGNRVDGDECPLSIVDAGTTIGHVVFLVHPDIKLQAGEVVATISGSTTDVLYQVISATVLKEAAPEANAIYSVKVLAGQLGVWDRTKCQFETVPWVPGAGHIVRKIGASLNVEHRPPQGREVVGRVPNSTFPVHVAVDDVVTHNTALIGVTGSGKSYLAFHLIEAMVAQGIHVLILDISRQHDLYLTGHEPTALKKADEVAAWFGSKSLIGIHQFAVDADGYPKVAADFAKAAFDEVSKAKLERGKNLPARLCIVLEEAHSLIPEWNQVAQKGDEQQVNRTARYILQGRKFGMGVVVVTQRTANVTKTILNQCNTIFALQSFDQTGLDFLRNYMGEEYSQAISTLPPRHAILVGKASSSSRPLLFVVQDLSDRWAASSGNETASKSAATAAAIPTEPGGEKKL
ncbi:MAG: DUF87 domain-containing protein [Holophagales bacterium]|nr:MAG: DUF87 domain-containing protein [Holophagales bacterium]